ncbi:MAG: preprotein translocase subunit SecA [Dehalococcoidia bacterium]
MLGKLLAVFGDSNEKQVKKYDWVVDEVNALEPDLEALSDDDLSAKTAEFRERLAEGDELDDLLPEAFATVREAARRTLGMRHFDVQLIGGAVLHDGKVAEMKTGEGKTLVATLPVYLNALEGKGVHVVTVNDYLARRDASWMGAVYHALGLSVACLQHQTAYVYEPGVESQGDGADGPAPAEMRQVSRKEAYLADITYGTNNEFGFDYLRDNMAADKAQQVQRDLNYAIVDEVDNILIDEARTPLIISGPAQESNNLYRTVAQVVPRLELGADYYIEEKERQAILTDEGISKVERLLKVDNLYDPANFALTHFVENGLRAHAIYKRDKDYVVKDGEVIIVDEFTGRLMPGRRYGEGMHQAIEAKEGVTVQRETITYATITLQNYFRMYPKLAGMTGTAITEAEEFFKVYKLEALAVPTNLPMVREDHADLVYKAHQGKWGAVIQDIAEQHEKGRPVLVGTVSIERSEELSDLLRKRGIPHEVLNAKNHEREAHIIAQAGRPGAVTVSTSMAGRGTDIILGGDPKAAGSPEQWQKDHDLVVSLGGLYVVGTERHESRRIDNQLRGRSGRQGDPGETRFFGSLQDDIMVRFGSGAMGRLVGRALPDDVPLESGMLTKTLEMTQSKVESYYFDIRKHLVEYDDVVNRHREVIYGERRKVLEGVDLKANIQEMVGRELTQTIRSALVGDPEEWDPAPMLAEINTIMPLPPEITADFVLENGIDATEDALLDAAETLYLEREEQFTPEIMRAIERAIMLQTVDRHWVQHLTLMQNLRQGIGLYAYGQRDPLVMYKKEGHEAFDALLGRIQHDIVHTIYHVAPAQQPPPAGTVAAGPNGGASGVVVGAGLRPAQGAVGGAASQAASRMASVDTKKMTTVMSKASQAGPAPAGSARTGPASAGAKIGRNDPCYCGSGKKYKRCHGAAA